ncbi:hypothetical protein FRC02_006875 [Tulasnella sp. 418]|nr:hypothetical protein FRC02_006875 [Tulasnella sp. 418]
MVCSGLQDNITHFRHVEEIQIQGSRYDHDGLLPGDSIPSFDIGLHHLRRLRLNYIHWTTIDMLLSFISIIPLQYSDLIVSALALYQPSPFMFLAAERSDTIWEAIYASSRLAVKTDFDDDDGEQGGPLNMS